VKIPALEYEFVDKYVYLDVLTPLDEANITSVGLITVASRDIGE